MSKRLSKRGFQTPRYPGTSCPQSDESIPPGTVVLPQDRTNDDAVRMSAWGAMRIEVYIKICQNSKGASIAYISAVKSANLSKSKPVPSLLNQRLESSFGTGKKASGFLSSSYLIVRTLASTAS